MAESQMVATPLVLADTQLADVYVYEVRVTRRAREDSDPKDPTDAPLSISVNEPDRGAEQWTSLISLSVVYPFREEAVAEVELSVSGVFTGSVPEQWQPQVTWVLWPHLRSALHQVARLHGFNMPLLPLLRVQGPQTDEQAAPTEGSEPEST